MRLNKRATAEHIVGRQEMCMKLDFALHSNDQLSSEVRNGRGFADAASNSLSMKDFKSTDPEFVK
jgi:hypothetical protein